MFKQVIAGIKNLWKWRKVIYYDRNYDHWFIYEILKTKLQFQAEYFQKHGYTENADRDAAKMLECIKLIDIVQNEVLMDKALQKDIWSDEELDAAIVEHDRTRKKLFQLLEENIEQWWD